MQGADGIFTLAQEHGAEDPFGRGRIPVFLDFNDDGYGDVAYAAGSATVGGKRGAGQIVALYGSAGGVTSTKRTTISQNTSGVPGDAETNDAFGWVSAYGEKIPLPLSGEAQRSRADLARDALRFASTAQQQQQPRHWKTALISG